MAAKELRRPWSSKGTFPLVRQRTVADAQSLCRWLDTSFTRPVAELLQGLKSHAAEVQVVEV